MTDVQVKIELGHKASPRSKPTKEGFTHDWTVFVRGPEQYNIANFVEKVVFHLHATFENPKRECKEPPYHVAEHGYAGFELPVVIHFKNKAEPRKIEFMYNLFLHMQETVTNSRYEKLTFQNPTEEFKKKLLKAGGVLMIPPEEVQFTSLFGPPIKTMDSPKKSKPSSSSVGFKDKPTRPSLDDTKPQSGKSKDKDKSSSKSSSSTGKSENNRDDGHREKSSKEKHSSSRKHTESPVLSSSSSKRHSESPNRHDSSSKKLKRSSSSSSFIDKKSKEKDRDVERDKEKQKELEREKERDKEKERERDKEKERERQKELEKERQREAERERQREMEEREREKERERERLKEIEKEKQKEKEREKLKLKEKEREKLRQKDKEREIEQEKLKKKEREKLKLKDKEREIEQEKLKDKDREKEKLRRKEKREKEKSSSNVTSEKHSKRKHSNSEKQKVREKENIENEPYKDSQKKPSVDSELKKRSENEREKSKGNIPSKSDSPSNSSSSRKDGRRKHEKTVPIPVKSPHKTKESNVEKTNKHSHREEKHKDKLEGKVLSHQKRTSNTQKSKPKKHVDGATSHRRKQLSKITSRELIDDLSLSDSSDSSSVSSVSSSVSGISSSSSDIGDSEVENAASVSRKSSTSSSKSAESTPTQKSALGVTKYMYSRMKSGKATVEFVCDLQNESSNSVALPDYSAIESSTPGSSLPPRPLGPMESSRVVSFVTTDTSDRDDPQNVNDTTDVQDQSTFDIPRPHRSMEVEVGEMSAADETINREDVGYLEETTTFDIVETGSTRGKRKLVASSGYTFVVKRQLRNETTEWRCCVRGKNTGCPAVVRQKGGSFTESHHSHTHPAQPGVLSAVKVKSEAKISGLANIFETATNIIRTVSNDVSSDLPAAARVSEEKLVRAVNRARAKTRPSDPEDFEETCRSTC